MDIFVPADALIAQKRYAEAIDLLQALLVSAPKRASAIKERIAKAQLLQADEEIDSQHYNEALAILSQFWALNPERADQAQRLIRKINQIRSQYNEKAKGLLAYMSDPKNRGDPSYNLEVTKRLDELDKLDFNNPDSKKTLTSLKETSLAFVNQDAMKAVMSAGRALIDSSRYVDAAREYMKGFDLFRPEFENAGYDEITVQAVANEVRAAMALPDSYEAAQAGLSAAAGALVEAFASGDPDRVGPALSAASASLDQLRGFRDSLFTIGSFFASTYSTIPKEDKSPIEYQYLAYLDLFVRGRPDSFGPDKKPDAEKAKPEGMEGVLLAQTKELLDRLGKAAQDSADAAYAQGLKAYDSSAFADAKAAFSRASSLSGSAARVLANWALVPDGYFVPTLDDYRAEIQASSAASTRMAQVGDLAAAGGRLADLAALTGKAKAGTADYAAKLDAGVPFADTRSALDGFRASILAIEASIQTEESGKAALSDAADAAAKGVGDDRPKTAFSEYSSRLDKVAAAAKTAEIGVAMARVSDFSARYSKLGSDALAYVARIDASVALKDERAAMDGFRSSVEAVEASIQAEEAGRAALSGEAAATAKDYGDEGPTTAFADYSSALDKAATEARAAEFAIATARAKVEGDYVERELAARSEAYGSALALIEGSPSQRPDRAGQNDPSPSSALRALDADSIRLSSLSAWIAGDLKSMGAEAPALAADPAFAAARSRIEALRDRAAKLQADHDAARAKAAERQKAAQASLAVVRQALGTANARLADAKALIAQDKQGAKTQAILRDFSGAQDGLTSAAASAKDAFSQDFVASSWEDFNQLNAQIGQDLALTKKNYVINETFRLLTEGQNYYFQGLFDLAAESLNRGQDLWHEDNGTDQEQVKYWQNQVRQASDTNNKLDVPESNSLYYEISGYLSEARKLYNLGDALMKAGKAADGKAALERATQNLNYVTSAFPLNEEAGFLRLQIAKSGDPSGYRLQLPLNISKARALLTTDSAAAYSLIVALVKMEPDNKDLKALLTRAEIDTGRRRAPPTKDQLSYSAARVAAAKKLLATGRTADAAQAGIELNDALDQNRGDPANKDAINLLRDLQILQGKASGLVLRPADQAILDKATGFYAAGQYNQARDQVDQLLADPDKKTQAVLKLDNDLKTKGY
jgi:hypothetical protein